MNADKRRKERGAAAAGLAQDEPCESAAGQHSRHWPDHRHGNRHHGGRPDCLSLETARIAWAVMLREKEYQPRAVAA
jgi:hypothetical protein